jgi:hypothetical protein
MPQKKRAFVKAAAKAAVIRTTTVASIGVGSSQ